MEKNKNDNNENIKNKTTYLILTLMENLKKKKNKKVSTKTLLLISLCVLGVFQNNNCLAEENVPLQTETYNFSSPALQYNPTTQTWESNQNQTSKKKKKKEKKQKEKKNSNLQNPQTTNTQMNSKPQPIVNTYQQPISTQNYQPQPVYQQHIQQNYATNNQPPYQTHQQYYTTQPQYYYQKQNNYYQRYTQQVLIPSGTPVSVYVEKLIDADDVNEGQEVLLRVQQPVKVQNITVIQANTPIIAQVIEHKNNFIFGVPGRIAVGNFKIKLPNGNVINLSGSIQHKGQNRYWVDFVAWFFLWPMIFVKGEDGKIQAGVQQMLYTNGDAYVTY